MERAIAEFVGIPAPAVSCWNTAHADVHWANLTSPLRLLDWEDWGRAPEGFDAATLYVYSLLQPDTAARVCDAFPVLGSSAGLATEATVCAQLLPDREPWGQPRSLRPRSGPGPRNCAVADRLTG
jgi:hypothetical protein